MSGGTPILPLPGFESREKKRFTLALIQKDAQILLGLKQRGFGVGQWNGFGGKIEAGETIRDAAAREIWEECRLTVKPEDLEEVGLILFEFKDDPVLMEVHIFRTETFTGQMEDTEEMKPKWFPKSVLPYAQMWPDDAVWYPIYTEGRKFSGHFLYEGYTKIISYILRDAASPSGEVILQKSA